jgi:hypothetical protein
MRRFGHGSWMQVRCRYRATGEKPGCWAVHPNTAIPGGMSDFRPKSVPGEGHSSFGCTRSYVMPEMTGGGATPDRDAAGVDGCCSEFIELERRARYTATNRRRCSRCRLRRAVCSD